MAVCEAHARAPSLLLVTVDTLRADRLGCYGGVAATPHLDRLAAQGVVFEAAYAAAPSTLPSVSALLTGRHPESFGLLDNLSLYPGTFPTLAQRLDAAGWRTGAVVSNWLLRERSGLAAGFDRYDAIFPRFEAHRFLPERDARETTDAALAMLERLGAGDGSPVFLWVHYQDPHGPYLPPGAWREPYLGVERLAPDGARELPQLADESGLGGIPRYQAVPGRHEAAWYRAGYDGEVSHADEHIGRLLAAWDARVAPQHGIVVVTADHGEGLGEDDYWFAHGELLSEALLRVPLVVRAPGHEPRRRADVASLVDMVPTLAAALGVPARDLPGRDLLAPGAERAPGTAYATNVYGASVRRHALITAEGAIVVAGHPRDERVVLHPRSGERATPTSEDARRMRERLAAVRSSLGVVSPVPPAPLDGGDRDRLRALGYLAE